MHSVTGKRLLVLALVLVGSGQLLAADGELDLTFGTGGKVTTSFSGDDFAFAIVLQPDGKIVVAGTTSNGACRQCDFAVARYKSDGSLDGTFGIGGKITTDFGAREIANAVALQADGKIIVAGSSGMFPGGMQFALARYNSDGSPDSTFGIDGKVTTLFTEAGENAHANANAVLLQRDGKIVVAGSSSNLDRSNPSDFALARYNSDGSLDPTFGSGGKATTDFSSRIDYVYVLALQSDGKIVAAGGSNALGAYFSGEIGPPGGSIALARYTPEGLLDTEFGTEGHVIELNDYWPGAAYAVAIQPDGKIVAAGGGIGVESGLRLVRYSADGTPDPTFGVGGRVKNGPDARSIALQLDGKIVVAVNPYVANVSLLRFNSDGSMDPSFGKGGYVGGEEGATALAIQADGRIVAAGGRRGI